MKKQFALSVLAVTFSFISTSYAGGFTPVPMPSRMHTAPIVSTAPSFTQIDSAGHFNITIQPMTQSSQNSFIVTTPITNSTQLYAVINNNTLYLRQNAPFHDPINVTVYMNTLTALAAFNGTSVSAANIRGVHLQINANTTGNISLNGMIMLDRMTLAGATQLNMKWVYGDDVVINDSGTSHASIAGSVNLVRIKLHDNSFLNAQYLRAKHTWIETNNFSQAQVLSTSSLQAYPNDLSNIYYYKTPGLLNPINSKSGNTLQLGWRH